MSGKEAIGGRLYLTNLRLVFSSHKTNRIVGQQSILLPTITGLSDQSRLLSKILRVDTEEQRVIYIVRRVPTLISSIEAARAALGRAESAELLGLATENLSALGLDMVPSPQLVRLIDNLDAAGDGVSAAIDIARGPLSALTLVSVIELAIAVREYRRD